MRMKNRVVLAMRLRNLMKRGEKHSFVVGAISDTHGPLSKGARAALRGVDRIVCAGDFVDPGAIQSLQRIAPTMVVRGNMDNADVWPNLTSSAVLQVGEINIYVLHDLYRLDLDPLAAGMHVIVHGHTHIPKIEWKNNVLYLNPGSAGPPRSSRPPSLALLEIEGEALSPRIVYLE